MASSRALNLRIGNAAASGDREGSLDQLSGFLGRIDQISASFHDVRRLREAIYAETDILFHTHGPRSRTVPCATIARLSSGFLEELRFYFDPTPLTFPRQ